MIRQWYIYALKDPRTDAIRYVGWALDVKRRVQTHLANAHKNLTHKDRWILKLYREGVTPAVEILETGAADDKKQAECAWILRLRAEGHDLTNTTAGGDGALGNVMSAEARAKISVAVRARICKDETRVKLSRAFREDPARLEQVKRLADHNRGKKRSAATIAKISAAFKGRPLSPEWCAKITAGNAQRGTTLSPERIAQLTASRQTPEVRAKMSASLTGRKLSPSTKIKIGISRRAAWKRDGGRAQPVAQPVVAAMEFIEDDGGRVSGEIEVDV